ncbi:MAG: transposase [Patescibacteria group bacterium]
MKKENYPQGSLPVKVGLADFNRYVNPYLSRGRRGPKTKVSRHKIFNYILYVLHTGIQWNRLPTSRKEISWSAVYQHHVRWCKDGSYKNLFESGVRKLWLRNKLDLSILHGDGSNTIAKKGVKESDTADTNIRKV